MRSFLDPKILSRLAPLPLKARIPMLGNVAGKHRSPVRGSSVEFAAYRKYVPGDDPRRLDWRAYGRSDRFYIKEFEADTNLRLCLIVDTSGSMNYKDSGPSKLDVARSISGTLSYLASGQGDAVGLYLASQHLKTQIPAKRGAAHLRVVLDNLENMTADGETGLVEILHETAERVSQRALVVIISDLFVRPELLSKCFQHLRFRKHDVAVFHMLDRTETHFEFDRPIRFLDLEGTAHILADPPLILEEYRKSVASYQERLKRIISESAVDYYRVSLDDAYDQVLAKFLLGRS